MRLVFATDLHGDAAAYEAVGTFALEARVDALVLGGDLCAYATRAAPQLAFVDARLIPFLARLRGGGVPVLLTYGNVDRPAVVERLRSLENEGLVHVLDSRPYELMPEDMRWSRW